MRAGPTAVLLVLLSTCVLVGFPKTERVWADGTFYVIYIRSSGSVEYIPPPPAPLIQLDGAIYTFTNSIYGNITVQKDDIVIDGTGHTLQGPGKGSGFYLLNRDNVAIKNTHISQFDYGIDLYESSFITMNGNNLTNNVLSAILASHSTNSTISRNNVVNNSGYGIYLGHTNTTKVIENNASVNGMDGITIGYRSFYNTIVNNTMADNTLAGFSLSFGISTGNTIIGNNITDNEMGGINIADSSGNAFCHNNLQYNRKQVASALGINLWDDGYLSGGNYWSDYSVRYPSVADNYHGENQDALGSDGIWDAPYQIDVDNQDNYPFVNPWTPQAHDVAIAEVEPSKIYVGQNYDVRINVTVRNQGSYTQTFNVTFYTNTTRIETKTLTLTSQSSETLTITWNTVGVLKGFYTLNATADQMPGEIDTLDNAHKNGTIKITIAGDVNGDTTVNVHDLFLIGKAYASTSPTNTNCDINEDNTVNQSDLEIATSNYSKTA